MKKKNGFTLVELLAILIILGIIAVITVPIIFKILRESRINASQDSAYGYVDAVNKLYFSGSLHGRDGVSDGYYTVAQLKSMGVSVSTEPSEGWVELEDDLVVSYSLKFGDYVVTKYRNSEMICEKGDVQPDEVTSKKMEISAKVDSYVKAALAANSSLSSQDALLVSEISGVSTDVPDSGWIHFNVSSNTVSVVDYSLTYGSITANYSSLTNGNYVSTFGDARNKPVIVELGDDVCLTETDCFKVIEINGTTATLLANNNIDPSTGLQGTNGQNYTVAFSQTMYWVNNNELVSDYSNNGQYSIPSYDHTIFVDTNNTQVYPDIYDSTKSSSSGTDYSVAFYVNQYVSNLNSLGINVTSGRILKYSEVTSGGIAYSYKQSSERYWLGTASTVSIVRAWGGNNPSTTDYNNSLDFGVRPVVYIGLSDID